MSNQLNILEEILRFELLQEEVKNRVSELGQFETTRLTDIGGKDYVKAHCKWKVTIAFKKRMLLAIMKMEPKFDITTRKLVELKLDRMVSTSNIEMMNIRSNHFTSLS